MAPGAVARALLLRGAPTAVGQLRGRCPSLATSGPASFISSLQESQHKFPLDPGGFLHVTCVQPSTTVQVTNGTKEDEVVIEATPPGSFASHAQPDGRVIDVVEAALPAPPLAATLSATMPSRFCGLSVTTAGGRVDVAVLQEAALRLETRGGDVAVRRARASSAVVSTMRAPGEPGRGGCVAIGELSASLLRVASGGGALRVDRVAALEAEVLTGGGTLSLGALYGVKACLSSSGGHIALSHTACSGLVQLDSSGGDVTVDGLEGSASILTAGGAVKVHLHERAQSVFVDSGGGNVEAWISPVAAGSLSVAAGGGVDVDPALKITGELGRTSLRGTTLGEGSGSAAGAAATSAAEARRMLLAARAAAAAAPSSVQAGSCGSSSSSSSSTTSSSSSLNASRLARAGNAQQTAIGGRCGGEEGTAQQLQLTINAGGGRVVLRAMGWMDGVRAKMAVRQGRPCGQS